MSALLQRDTCVTPPLAVGGNGCYLTDSAGRQYLDASGGAAVSCLGHGDPAVVAAIAEQAGRLAWTHNGFFTTAPAEELAERLIATAPPGIAKAFLVSSGSEAIEASLKLARQYFLEIGEPDRVNFIARRQSYHGNTLGALAIGGNAARRRPYEPILPRAHHVAACFAYREKRDDETEEAYGLRVADDLEAKIRELGPHTVAAFVAEPVVGATAGAVTAVPGYFRRIREICDRHGVLLILDEVMCGMGRTGTLHASEQEGIAPDIVTIAKGLGGGYQPIGGMLLSDRIFRAIRDGSGAFQHGHTYLAHPVACAAALAVQKRIAEGGLLDNVRRMGDALDAALTERFGNHPHVGDIRGRGLLRAVELVADRSTKATFDPAHRLHARIKAKAMAEGLICYPMGGTVDGRHGDHVVLAPPYIVETGHIEELTDKLSRAIDAALAEVHGAA